LQCLQLPDGWPPSRDLRWLRSNKHTTSVECSPEGSESMGISPGRLQDSRLLIYRSSETYAFTSSAHSTTSQPPGNAPDTLGSKRKSGNRQAQMLREEAWVQQEIRREISLRTACGRELAEEDSRACRRLFRLRGRRPRLPPNMFGIYLRAVGALPRIGSAGLCLLTRICLDEYGRAYAMLGGEPDGFSLAQAEPWPKPREKGRFQQLRYSKSVT
jgi:hypothetical protein